MVRMEWWKDLLIYSKKQLRKQVELKLWMKNYKSSCSYIPYCKCNFRNGPSQTHVYKEIHLVFDRLKPTEKKMVERKNTNDKILQLQQKNIFQEL